MAVREYIGARYVPLFGRKDEESIEWDNTKPYEPLTVVLHQGNSYTSRQYVPTGIDITNADFWALTGNYNAQVEAYRNEVMTFDGRITANSDAITDLSGDLNDLEDEVTADGFVTTNRIDDDAVTTVKIADDAITSAKIENGAVNTNEIADGAVTSAKLAKDKCFVSFGDSWSTTDDPNVNHYADWLDWWIESSDYVSGNVFRFANGGAGWLASGEHGSMATQLTNAVSTMTETQRNNTDKVLAIAGINDVSHGSTYSDIQTAISNFITDCHNAFPNATVYLCPLNVPGSGYANIKALCRTYHKELFTYVPQLQPKNTVVFDMINWFIPFLPWESSVFAGTNTMHFSAMGNRIMCQKIGIVLNGGIPANEGILSITPKNSCQFNSTNSADDMPFIRIHEGMLYIENLVWFTVGAAMAKGDTKVIGTIQGASFPQLTGYRPDTPVFFQPTGGFIGKIQFEANGDLVFKSDFDGSITTTQKLGIVTTPMNCW